MSSELKKNLLNLDLTFDSIRIIDSLNDKMLKEAIEYSLILLENKKDKGATKYLFKDIKNKNTIQHNYVEIKNDIIEDKKTNLLETINKEEKIENINKDIEIVNVLNVVEEVKPKKEEEEIVVNNNKKIKVKIPLAKNVENRTEELEKVKTKVVDLSDF